MAVTLIRNRKIKGWLNRMRVSPEVFREAISEMVLDSSSTEQDLYLGFRGGESVLLNRAWIEVSLQCGFELCLAADDNATNPKPQDETRFRVDMDMGMEKPTPLAMGWFHFVLFALAIGVSPYSKGLRLESSELFTHESVLRTSQVGDRTFVKVDPKGHYFFDIRRALAWNNVMVVKRRESWFCWALGQEKIVPLDSIYVNSWLQSPVRPLPARGSIKSLDLESRYQLNGYSWDSINKWLPVIGEDPQDCQHPLAAAITWLFYGSVIFQSATEFYLIFYSLPITQRIHEARERSLCFLNKLDREGCLESKIRDLSSVGSEQVGVAGQVLHCIREAIVRSVYVQNSFRFCEALLRIKNAFENFFDGNTQPSVEEPQALLGTIIEGGHFIFEPGNKRTTAMMDTRLLASFEKVKRLRSSFNPHESDGATEQLELGDESDEMTLLAHVLLGLANWEMLEREPWAIGKFGMPLVQQIESRLENFSPGEDNQHTEEFIAILNQGLRKAERGIYTAPSLPLRHLLRSSDEMIYLL